MFLTFAVKPLHPSFHASLYGVPSMPRFVQLFIEAYYFIATGLWMHSAHAVVRQRRVVFQVETAARVNAVSRSPQLQLAKSSRDWPKWTRRKIAKIRPQPRSRDMYFQNVFTSFISSYRRWFWKCFPRMISWTIFKLFIISDIWKYINLYR